MIYKQLSVFLIYTSLLSANTFAMSISTFTPFLSEVTQDSTSFAVFKINKSDPGDKISVKSFPTTSGLSVICNSCAAFAPECFIELKFVPVLAQQISTPFTITNQSGEEQTLPLMMNVLTEPYNISSLLLHVVRGEEDLVKKVLDKNPALALEKGSVTDYSGRRFSQISPLQYALWAYDRHMWRLILNYLPKAEAKQQLLDLEINGTEHGKHYNFQEIVDAIEAYQQNRKKAYIDLGKAQRNVPIHVANEYTRKDRIFYPTPYFTDAVLPRYDFNNINPCHSWFPLSENIGLGFDYAIGRGERPWAWANDPLNRRKIWYSKVDKTAIAHLFDIRQKEYNILKTDFDIPLIGSPINQLLNNVAKDQLNEAETIIKIRPNILLQKGIVIDYSNRVFKDITPFQYAVWAYDAPMWNMMLKYLPKEEAKKQLIEYESNVQKYGKHFDFEELLSYMRDFVNACNNIDDPNCGDFWTQIGKGQRKLPAYIANVLTNNGKLGDGFNWFPLSPYIGLGYDWAIYHFLIPCDAFFDYERRGFCPSSNQMGNIVSDDYTKFKNLEQTSLSELNNLKIILGYH